MLWVLGCSIYLYNNPHPFRCRRLKRPPLCPENVYADLMLPCWNLVPKLRPDFGRILEILKTFVAEFGEVI